MAAAFLLAGGALVAGESAAGGRAPADPATRAAVFKQQPPEEGRVLYEERCATCHGEAGEGTDQGPRIGGLGPGVFDFQLSTGRMPLARPGGQAVRKPPALAPAQIESLVGYLAMLPPGDGIPIPAVETEAGDLPTGQRLYQLNCAPCHGASGNGGSVGKDVAPALEDATPTQIGEAVWIGPGTMPVFRDAFSQSELDSVARYVVFLRRQPDPGGTGLDHIGPIVEGFVALLFGLGAAVAMARVMGTRS